MKKLFKKLLFLVLALGIMLVQQACENDSSTTEPEVSDHVILPPTNVMDETSRKAIKTLDTTNFTFIFSEETDFIKNLEVGHIIVDSISDLAPYGYLRKITSIVNNRDSGIIINTEATRLIDVADSGEIDFSTGKILQSKVEKIVLGDGVKWVGQKGPKISVYEFDYSKSFEGPNGKFTVEGHTALELDFFFRFSWRWVFDPFAPPTFGYPEVRLFKSGVKVNQLASINAKATGACPLAGEKISLAKYYLSPWTFMFGPVPVVFVPRIELFLLPTGEVKAEFTATASERFEGKIGTRYTHSNGWSKISEVEYETDYSAPNISVATNFKVNIGPEVALLLYGICGPYANISAFSELNSSQGTADNLWYLDFFIGVEAEVGATIDILFYSTSWGTTFELFKKLLLHCDNEPFENMIYIESPTNGSQYAIGDNIDFKCAYTGDTPDEVRFYLGSNLIYTDTEAPYEYNWESEGSGEGLYTLKVVEIIDGIEVSTDVADFYLRKVEWSAIDLSYLGITDNMDLTGVAFKDEHSAVITVSEVNKGKILFTDDDGESWTVHLETNFGIAQFLPLLSGQVWEDLEMVFVSTFNKVFNYYINVNGDVVVSIFGYHDYFGNIIPSFQWKKIYGIGANKDGEVLAVGKDTGIPYRFEVYRADKETHEPFPDYSLPHPNEYGYSPKLCVSEDHVLVYGIQDENLPNQLFYEISRNGGNSWEDLEFEGLTDADRLNGAYIFNDDLWWIVGKKSSGEALVLISQNGGMDWETVIVEAIRPFTSVVFINPTKGFATIDKTTDDPEPKMYQTTDGGHSWEPVLGLKTTQGLKTITFVGDSKALAVGKGPIIYKYGVK